MKSSKVVGRCSLVVGGEIKERKGGDVFRVSRGAKLHA